MRLKKLTIFGFKSFADKTILHFDQGITCIVGPNGCGKSNIADAFRWVLGEQSAKSLRGGKMPDVIFAGTYQRKALNYAEVSLTLTDIQGALPIQYEEITIARRLHRSGESEYLLNGNSVRLKDLQSLFLDSGVGKNAFSIFEQGKLDQVINYSPHERRYIFEEAAGILRFLQRKEEALKRMAQADLNFARVRDIHLEVEKQLHTLESQAKKARLYKEQQAQLEVFEKTSFLLRWQFLDSKQSDLQAKHEKHREALEECQNRRIEKQTQCHEAKQKKQEHERALRVQSETVLTLKGKQEMQIREVDALQQRLKEIQQRDRKLKNELEALALSSLTRAQKKEEMQAKQNSIELKWNEVQSQWLNRQESVKILEKEVFRLRQELTSLQQAYLKCLQDNNQLESEVKQTEIRLENQMEQHAHLENRLTQFKAECRELEKGVSDKKQQLLQVSGLVDSHKDRLDQFEEDLKELNHQKNVKQQAFESLSLKIIEIKARQHVLMRLRDEYEGFSSGSKKLLEESKKEGSLLYQTLRPFYEYFEAEKETAEALAVVLRGYAQTLVVNTAREFKNVLHFALTHQLQDFSLVCIEFLNGIPPVDQLSKELLAAAVKPNRLVWHFLENISVVSSGEAFNGSSVSIESWNTKEGIFVDHRGVLLKIKPSENQVFLREAELKAIEEALVGYNERLCELELTRRQIDDQRSRIQTERSEVDKLLRREEMKLVEVNFSLQRTLSDLEKNKNEQNRIEREAKLILENCELQRRTFQDLQSRYLHAKKELAVQLQKKDNLQAELAIQEEGLRLQDADQKEKGTLYRQLADERLHFLHQAELLESQEQEAEKSKNRIGNECFELDALSQKIHLAEMKSQQNSLQYGKEVEVACQCYEELDAKSQDIHRQVDELERQMGVHYEKVRLLEKQLVQLDGQLFHQQTNLQAVIEELYNRYQLTVEEAFNQNLPLNRSLEQTEKLIKQLRLSLQEAGDVNLTAIEDLERQQLRFEFLKNQMNDMQYSKGELLTLIQQLEGESHKLFRETFETIRANFKKNFQILFNGGEADLQFTDSQDILAAGIEITAKPPGKQMRSISLLSGGEKCLTAVALLFAIFEVKPAPFCILDEIDAPLDDTNVDRFVNVVKHFIDRCQFLIITHNKRTMAIGDVLFGVSMEEKGVSKLLSLEFAHRETPEASLV